MNKEKSNSLGIIGFIFAFIMPVLGLIFSIMGFKRCKDKTVENLSIAGAIISIVELLVIIILLLSISGINSPIITILYLILMLGLLIFVHELGHFIAAKKIGVYVSEFALGMGPKVFSFKRKLHDDPTEYSLRILPIGGFCAMAGEVNEDEENLKKEQYMCNRSKRERILILVAGVTMNVITAFVILLFQAFIYGASDQRPIVYQMAEGYPISQSGIEVGDRILKINNYRINSWDKLTLVLNLKSKSKTYSFTVKKKDGSVKTYNVTPKMEETEDGQVRAVFGIKADDSMHRGFIPSLTYAFSKLGSTISTMIMIIVSLFTGKLGLSALSGPVGMYSIVGQSAAAGFYYIMYLTAYLSLNLAVINILPFPAFDGGRVLFVIIEAIKGKKVDAKLENIFHTVGFILLMLLMVYITIQDIIRLT